ncbi:hypothetical protein AB0M72_04810 [Nocardiopsis dassonvillei]
MELRKLGATSQDGACPTLYETGTGVIVMQGDKLTGPEALRKLSDVLADQEFVVVPRALLTRFAPKE